MFNKNELEGWIREVANNLAKPCSIYMIGGCAMSFKGLKPATKDVDIIVTSKNEFIVFDKAIVKAGFKRSTDIEEEFYITALAVYEKEDSRIDVFLNAVGKMLRFTKTMKERAALYNKIGHLKIFLASNEDIFLFKAMTPRAADIADGDRLMREGLDYNAIYKECISQSTSDKQWYFWLYEKICQIEDKKGIKVPIKNKLFAVVKKNWGKRPDDFMVGAANIEKEIKKF